MAARATSVAGSNRCWEITATTVPAARCASMISIGLVQGHLGRLLDDHVLAGCQGFDSHLAVGSGRGAHDDHIDLDSRQRIGQGLECLAAALGGHRLGPFGPVVDHRD